MCIGAIHIAEPATHQGQILLHTGVVANRRQSGLEVRHGPLKILMKADGDAEQVSQ